MGIGFGAHDRKREGWPLISERVQILCQLYINANLPKFASA